MMYEKLMEFLEIRLLQLLKNFKHKIKLPIQQTKMEDGID